MGIPEERIHTIPHFYTPKGPPPLQQKDGYALFVGRLSLEKGVAQLLDAWEILGRRNKTLIIAGNGPERSNLEDKVRAKRLQNVKFLGFVQQADQEAVWAGAAFSLVPSIWLEPFGMVVLESWARARPVLANRIGALPEIIEHGATGLLAEPLDSNDLAHQMAVAFDSPDQTAEMGAAGRRLLELKYAKREWLEKIDAVFRAV